MDQRAALKIVDGFKFVAKSAGLDVSTDMLDELREYIEVEGPTDEVRMELQRINDRLDELQPRTHANITPSWWLGATAEKMGRAIAAIINAGVVKSIEVDRQMLAVVMANSNPISHNVSISDLARIAEQV